ncbi:FG-GAP-like repeat-containing protein [Streptomyces sp. NPDC090093]|uniref:FG-GAP-like repeat-containing protein n=1 Tax=Streptomyces sp. NPDC090093 TaxID=3365945 RepID=UPI0038307B1B
MNRTIRTTARSRGRRRALGTALAVLASSAALAATGATQAQAAEGAQKPRVVFTEYKDVEGVRHSSVVTVNTDGSDRRVLVPTGPGLPKAEITGVTYSPDGLRMAFISNDGYSDIWVADADGQNAVPVRMDIDEPDGWLNGLDWTPDGKRLYLSFRAKPGHDRLRIMQVNLDGTGLGYVFAEPEKTWDTQVDVAWDGRITFLRGTTIHLWDPRVGGDPKPVTQGLHPTFSPNGDRIAFSNGADGSYDVHAIALDSGAQATFSYNQNVLLPEWSPDGSAVAFLSGGTAQKATVIDAADPSTGQTSGIQVLSAPGATASDIGWVAPRGWSPRGTFRHDFTGDGIPDVLAQDASGVLWRYDGNGTGGLKARVEIGRGWTGYSFTVAGDLSADGIPDVVAQDAAGDLWRVDGNGAGGLRPKVKIGWGWQGLTLSGVGDLDNGARPTDGFSDLLALDGKGDLWLYGGDGRGGLLPRVNQGAQYQGYRLTGVGALAPSGSQAYLGQKYDGELFRYEEGTREKIGWGWKDLTLTGVGDLTGDGVPDVLARDTAGDLWRYDGDGTGGLKTRVKIGWGWNGLSTF